MYIKTTADIVNEINWHGLDFRERLVLKTMIDLSFKTRLIKILELDSVLYEEFSLSSITYYLTKLRTKGFVDRHLINGVYCYETIPFTERVPCV